jgi:hypothetical protein
LGGCANEVPTQVQTTDEHERDQQKARRPPKAARTAPRGPPRRPANHGGIVAPRITNPERFDAVQAWFWARLRGETLSPADADDLLGVEFAAELGVAERERTLVEGDDAAGALEGVRPPLRGYLATVAPKVEELQAIERELRAAFCRRPSGRSSATSTSIARGSSWTTSCPGRRGGRSGRRTPTCRRPRCGSSSAQDPCEGIELPAVPERTEISFFTLDEVDWRLRADLLRRWILRGRANRAHEHGLDPAARERRGGVAARTAPDLERIAAADQAAEGTHPTGDLNATPEYKRHLARVLTRRALTQAARI